MQWLETEIGGFEFYCSLKRFLNHSLDAVAMSVLYPRFMPHEKKRRVQGFQSYAVSGCNVKTAMYRDEKESLRVVLVNSPGFLSGKGISNLGCRETCDQEDEQLQTDRGVPRFSEDVLTYLNGMKERCYISVLFQKGRT